MLNREKLIQGSVEMLHSYGDRLPLAALDTVYFFLLRQTDKVKATETEETKNA